MDKVGEYAPSRRYGASPVRNNDLRKPLRMVVLRRPGRCGLLPMPGIWPVALRCCRTGWWSPAHCCRCLGRSPGCRGCLDVVEPQRVASD